MTQKRILVVTQHFWPENFRINDMVEGFLAHGIAVDVLCGLPNYPRGEWFKGYGADGPFYEEWKGASIFRAREIRRKGNTSLRIFLNYVSWPIYASFNLHHLKKDYDAVLCYNTSPVCMAAPALRYGRRRGVPVTTYVLDLWPENLYSVLPIKNPLLRWGLAQWSAWYYRRADRLITMSEPLRRRLAAVGRKSPEAVGVIPQYCEDFYAADVYDSELAARFAGKSVFVFAGNFSPAQSLPTVVEAACLARADGAESLHLLLVGDGMSRPEVEALVAQRNAGDFITLWGSVAPTDIPRFHTLATALVAPLADSPDLGLTVPAKIASYMAAGRPVLASITGEGARAVEEAGCGLTSPAGDAQALARNMAALCAMDDDQLALLGQNARAYYKAHYSRDVLLARMEAFLLDMEG